MRDSQLQQSSGGKRKGSTIARVPTSIKKAARSDTRSTVTDLTDELEEEEEEYEEDQHDVFASEDEDIYS